MRIGIDCRLWNETGVGRYIRNLVYELGKIDHTNQYILFFKESEYKNVQVPAENFQKRVANLHWHSVKEQLFLPGILFKEKLDIMHFPYFSVPLLYTRPFIITIHDLIINHLPTGKASTRKAWIYQIKVLAYKVVLFFTLKHAKKVIAVSDATKKEIMRHYKRKSQDIIVTLEGVDEKISHPKDDQPLVENLKSQISNFVFPYFLYVGNVYPHKNLESLVKAFYFLAMARKEVKLILVGKQDFFYKRLKETIKKFGLSQRVLFYEKVSDERLAGLYREAIALIAPSLMEGFGLPVLEAMANRCPVICSRIPSFREVADDAAVYFDPRDPKDIKKKLELIIVHPELRKDLVEKGLKRTELFSWEKMAEETLGVYQGCIYE